MLLTAGFNDAFVLYFISEDYEQEVTWTLEQGGDDPLEDLNYFRRKLKGMNTAFPGTTLMICDGTGFSILGPRKSKWVPCNIEVDTFNHARNLLYRLNEERK